MAKKGMCWMSGSCSGWFVTTTASVFRRCSSSAGLRWWMLWFCRQRKNANEVRDSRHTTIRETDRQSSRPRSSRSLCPTTISPSRPYDPHRAPRLCVSLLRRNLSKVSLQVSWWYISPKNTADAICPSQPVVLPSARSVASVKRSSQKEQGKRRSS